MKSTFHQVPNMKGKRTHLYGCRCCAAQDFREDYFEKLDLLELVDSISDYYHGIDNDLRGKQTEI